MLRVPAIIVLLCTIAPAVRADWPFSANDGLKRGSKEYYEARANDPPGSRQFYKFGKLWPPQPRPTGEPQTFVHKYHNAVYWPHPYICQDREYVAALTNAQASNGWVNSTILYDYHFDQVTGDLNSAGMSHLNWIVTCVPAEHQQIRIAATNDMRIANERKLSVEQSLAQIPGIGTLPPVETQLANPVGRPANEVQSIFKNAHDNMPPPMLSKISAGDNASK